MGTKKKEYFHLASQYVDKHGTLLYMKTEAKFKGQPCLILSDCYNNLFVYENLDDLKPVQLTFKKWLDDYFREKRYTNKDFKRLRARGTGEFNVVVKRMVDECYQELSEEQRPTKTALAGVFGITPVSLLIRLNGRK